MKSSHRPYVLCSLTFLLGGTLLGLLLLPVLAGQGDARYWVERLRAHGQMQVFGFCVLFTMGIAYQMLGELLSARQSPKLLKVCLGSMAMGTLGTGFYPLQVWPWLQMFSGILFLAGVARHRPAAGTVRRNVAHSHYLRWGSLWLLIALVLQVAGQPADCVLELTLWGFLSLCIMGVGLRVHPAMLGRSAPPAALQWSVLLLWNLGLLLTWLSHPLPGASCLLLGASLLVAGLKPWPAGPSPHGWPLRAYLGWAYAWLVLACAGRLAMAWPGGPEHWAGAVKHAHASGFVLTMMVGMGLRLVPAFERKPLAWPPARWLCLLLLCPGGVLRVAGQAGLLPWALLPGGICQVLAVVLFAFTLLATLAGRGHELSRPGFAESNYA